MAERVPDAEGEIRFVDILETDPALSVKVEEIRPDDAAGTYWIDWALTNQTPAKLELRGVAALESAQAEVGSTQALPAGRASRLTLKSKVAAGSAFWLLRQGIERAAASGGDSSLLTEARWLLVVPPEVSRDLTHFTTDPRPMLAHRDRLAQMIERMQSAAPRSR